MHIKVKLSWFGLRSKSIKSKDPTQPNAKPAKTDANKKKKKAKKRKFYDSSREKALKLFKFDKKDTSTPRLFKLNIDCVGEICEWMSLRDLKSFGETCRAMKYIVGEYFQRNYAAASVICKKNSLVAYNADCGRIDVFSRFVKKVLILYDEPDDQRFQYIAANCGSIKQLQLKFVTLSDENIGCLKETLTKLQLLRVVRPRIYGDFYDKFLKHCTELQTLSVRSGDRILVGSSNEWLLREYPTLKHFEMSQVRGSRIGELRIFLELNPQLRSIGVNSSLLWENRQIFLESDIKLQDFAMIVNFVPSRDFPAYYRLLNQLHAKGFYKRLHLYIFSFDSEAIRKMASLQSFVKLYSAHSVLDKSLVSSLINLKELSMDTSDNLSIYPEQMDKTKDIDIMAKNLVNLERIYFYKATFEHVLLFFRHSKKLRKIEIRHLMLPNETEFNRGILDLAMLNKERSQLRGAEKIHIYLKESLFMRTKWTTSAIDFPTVELKLAESHDWSHHFLN